MANYAINSGSEIPGVVSTWRRLRRRAEVDNQVTFTNMAFNTWRLQLMSMTDFETFKAAEGDALTLLETNDPDDRDAFLSYSTVYMGLVEGRHDGVNMRDVTIQFEVDLNSEGA